jgi:uroporphyrinogen decarboxylase
MRNFFSVDVKPDADELMDCIARRKTPARVHPIEIFLDSEVEDAIARRFSLDDGQTIPEPAAGYRRHIAVQRFLGYDYVLAGVRGLGLQLPRKMANDGDSGALARTTGRAFVEEGRGPITDWPSFERYAWPEPAMADLSQLEWYQRYLPDDMCILGGLAGHVAEELSFLMGYETLCIALYDQPDLVATLRDKIVELHRRNFELLLQFPRVRAVWGTDDMGFRTGPLLAPGHLREHVLPAHALYASMAHEAGRLYLLHSCGKLDLIMDDIVSSVQADAKHSFEDTIEDVADAMERWGGRIAFLGGMDVDFMCRADEAAVRARVRHTLDRCGTRGYCLGTGNSVANYLPIDNYLAMLDEGRRYGSA